MPAELLADIQEPEAINKVFDFEYMTYTVMSQDVMNLATYNAEDNLHCVVSGLGERVSLVSPYQRFGIKAGQPTRVKNP